MSYSRHFITKLVFLVRVDYYEV